MRKKHNLLIGERTAEDIKIKIGSAFRRTEVDYMDVRGRHLVTGLPRTVKVSSEETEEALREAGRCLRCDHYGCGSLEGGRGE